MKFPKELESLEIEAQYLMFAFFFVGIFYGIVITALLIKFIW